MAREEGTEAAALPKLLLDLIEQVEGSKGSQKRTEGENGSEAEAEKKEDDLQQDDIAHNLPKVTRNFFSQFFPNVIELLTRYSVSGLESLIGAAELSRRRCSVSLRGIILGS